MEVILLQKVANLGNIGDRVKVKSGFGRNYLLPTGKATLATPEHIAAFEARRAELEAKAAGEFSGAQVRAAKLEGFALTMTAKAGNEGKLFGSIGTADIAEACRAAGHDIERSEVRLPGEEALEDFIALRSELEMRTVDYVLSIRPMLSTEQQQRLIGLSQRGRRWRGGRS